MAPARGHARQLRSSDFPTGTPLNHFFAWNEQSRRPDRRYVVACDLHDILAADRGDAAARARAVGRLDLGPAAAGAAQETVERLAASIGCGDVAAHAALFAAFEKLADEIDLRALAAPRPRLAPSRRGAAPRRILIIRLSALGDFVQALGPAAAIRRHHRGDRITLLTTAAFAGFAARLGLFDEVTIDRRPSPLDVAGWLSLRRVLRAGRFDRVYDLQTSERSACYARLFHPGPTPEWSGAARGCSHPHANLGRDRQHTIDKQAEQLLMAGIYPTPLPALLPLVCDLPPDLAGRRFVLLAPGSSPRHPEKRWPANRFGTLAAAFHRAGYPPVVIGAAAERPLAAAIAEICPAAIDLTGRTDLISVAALAQRAVLTVGNDTGVTHLAAAAECPIVVLFSGNSDPDWCAPRGRMVRVLAEPDLNDLDTARVFAGACEIIGLPGKPLVRPEPAPAAGEGWR